MVTFPGPEHPGMAEPGPPHGVRHFCPVDECDWWHDVAPPSVDDTALASVFGIGVMASVAHAQHMQRVEDELRTHLEGHDVVAWARTVARLRQENDQLMQENQHLVHTVSTLEDGLRQANSRGIIPAPTGYEHSTSAQPPREQRYAPPPETPRYSADLPAGVVGIKGL